MRRFNFKSYWNTFKWMMFSNHRDLLAILGGITLAAAVAEEMTLMPAFSSRRFHGYDIQLMAMAFFLSFLGSAWMMYGASRTFADTKSRHAAIALLMHPATNLEKFLARITYYTILWIVITVVGATLGDILRYCFNNITDWHADTPMLITSLDTWTKLPFDNEKNTKDIAEAIVFTTALSIWTHSFYVLGSAFFRRNRFLFTTITLCIVQIAAGSVIPYTPVFGQSGLDFTTLAAIPMIALAAVQYWLAYFIFTRMQVINNKWISL